MSIIGTIRDAVTGLTASVEARKQTPTGNALNVQIGPGDVISNIPVVMDFAQHQVHEGESHHANDERLTLKTTTVKYGLTVPVYNPTIAAPHLIISVDCYDGAALVRLYEGATFTGGAEPTAFATLTDQQKLDIIDAHLLTVIQNLARTQHSLAAQEAARLTAATEAETKFI